MGGEGKERNPDLSLIQYPAALFYAVAWITFVQTNSVIDSKACGVYQPLIPAHTTPSLPTQCNQPPSPGVACAETVYGVHVIVSSRVMNMGSCSANQNSFPCLLCSWSIMGLLRKIVQKQGLQISLRVDASSVNTVQVVKVAQQQFSVMTRALHSVQIKGGVLISWYMQFSV